MDDCFPILLVRDWAHVPFRTQLSIEELRHIPPRLARLRQRVVVPEAVRQALESDTIRLVPGRRVVPLQRQLQRFWLRQNDDGDWVRQNR